MTERPETRASEAEKRTPTLRDRLTAWAGRLPTPRLPTLRLPTLRLPTLRLPVVRLPASARGLADALQSRVAAVRRRLGGRVRSDRRPMTAIVPGRNVAGRALVFVIAIMTFLSCLTLGAVTLVRESASTWQSQISREATIQIRPADDFDIEAALEQARDMARTHAGVRAARIVDRAATARLLEPWLGTGLDIDELPVPRLVVVTIDETAPPDFAAMRAELTGAIANLSLDDHRTWVDRLVSMARTTVAIGTAALVLMLSATVLTVVFATRGAMAGNAHIIEVLHFVGAEARFIANEFRQHFLITGLKGTVAGGALAVLVFLGFGWWSARNLATPEADQAAALFGQFAIGLNGYLGVAAVSIIIAMLTAITSHITVLTYLDNIDSASTDL